MDARSPKTFPDCIYSDRAKAVWNSLVDAWLEDNKRETEQKKRQKEIYDLKVAKAKVARIKREEEVNLARAYWQMNPFKGERILWEDL